MKDDNRFIGEVIRIVEGALRLDINKVRNYTDFLASRLQEAGEKQTADRLRKLLQDSDTNLRPSKLAFTNSLPVDPETRFSLLEKVDLKAFEEARVVLSETQWRIVHEFLSVAKSQAQLESLGVHSTLSLLMYGPPGCGKNRLARHIARDLGLDLYIARLDGLISSFVGSTAKNIKAIFEFAAQTPCVLFLDEFDAVAKLRGDAQEVGELKRVVNSFIQNLDTLGTQTIVLAATNHPELLDAAVWRRFVYKLELSRPDLATRIELWNEFLSSLDYNKKEILILADLSDGFSGSDIHDVAKRLIRAKVLKNSHPPLSEAFHLMRNAALGQAPGTRFLSSISNATSQEIAVALRERNESFYSHAVIASLLGVSKATAFRASRKGDIKHG